MWLTNLIYLWGTDQVQTVFGLTASSSWRRGVGWQFFPLPLRHGYLVMILLAYAGQTVSYQQVNGMHWGWVGRCFCARSYNAYVLCNQTSGAYTILYWCYYTTHDNIPPVVYTLYYTFPHYQLCYTIHILVSRSFLLYYTIHYTVLNLFCYTILFIILHHISIYIYIFVHCIICRPLFKTFLKLWPTHSTFLDKKYD